MSDTWWWVVGLVAAGLILGTVASTLTRRYLGHEKRRAAIREVAGPAATLLFWLFVAAGLIAAVASASPKTIEDVPSDLLAWLPNLGVAGIILICGFVVANLASAAVARTARRATGERQPALETLVKGAIVAGAGVLALTQLGVDTTLLDMLVATTAIGIAVALAGIAIVGGRDTARSVAAGKTLSEHLAIGASVTCNGRTGVVERLTATHAVIAAPDGDCAIVAYGAIDDLVIHA